jgi:hypothetical protein
MDSYGYLQPGYKGRSLLRSEVDISHCYTKAHCIYGGDDMRITVIACVSRHVSVQHDHLYRSP